MSAPASSSLASERSPGLASAPGAEKRLAASEIDASCRNPLLLLFVSAMAWLVLGVLLALISSIKLHAPGFLASPSWLTLGRVHPAAMNAILYGFASQAAIGAVLWMMCRLGAMRLPFQTTIILAATFWNLGVTLGILGILAGGSTGFAWLEMPRYASPILFGAYSLIGACTLAAFWGRSERSLYVSQWFLLAALFWFPWIYSAANLLLVFSPVRGVVQSIISAWFTSNFLGLWLGPVALAAIFYFIPKLSGRPLYSQSLAAFGFWTLAVFSNWTGLGQLVGGPVPAWMASAGIAASVLLLLPLISLAMNWHLTLRGLYARAWENMTLRFILIAAGSYLVAGVLGIILSLREVSAFTHLTYVESAQSQLAVLGFASMALLGSIHYIVPRILQMPWPCERKVLAHFWCSAVGFGLVFLSLFLGGLVQASALHDPAVPFSAVTASTTPFVGIATLGQFLFLAGQVTLLWNLLMMVRAYAEPVCQSLTALLTEGRARKEEARP